MVSRNDKENGKKLTRWTQVLPKEGVACLYGHRRKGKSGTAWWLIEDLHKKGKKIAAFMFPKKAAHLIPKWVKKVYTIADLKKLRGYVVVADEMALHAFARDHQSDSNKELYKLMAVSGQCHQLLILICQHTRQLDVGLAMEPDVMILKQPSLLHIRFARPELKPELQQAFDAFQGARGDKRGFAFVVNYHNGDTGFLRTKLPTFWSEKLSEAYALFEMETLTPKKSKPKKKAPTKA